jgi:hypothetical protein
MTKVTGATMPGQEDAAACRSRRRPDALYVREERCPNRHAVVELTTVTTAEIAAPKRPGLCCWTAKIEKIF